MANGPLGGNMGTPPVPPQPPQVSFETTAQSRGNFNNFLKSMPNTTAMTPIPPLGSAPMMPAPNPMNNIDIFNQPPSMGMGMMGMNQPQIQQPMQQPMMQSPMMGGLMGTPVQNFFFGGEAMDFEGFSDSSDPFGGGDSFNDSNDTSDPVVGDTFDRSTSDAFQSALDDITLGSDDQAFEDDSAFRGVNVGLENTGGFTTGVLPGSRDERFARFYNPDYAMRAIGRDFQTKVNKNPIENLMQGKDPYLTVGDYFETFTPSSENPGGTGNRVAEFTKATGKGADDILSLNDMNNIMDIQAKYEAGIRGVDPGRIEKIATTVPMNNDKNIATVLAGLDLKNALALDNKTKSFVESQPEGALKNTIFDYVPDAFQISNFLSQRGNQAQKGIAPVGEQGSGSRGDTIQSIPQVDSFGDPARVDPNVMTESAVKTGTGNIAGMDENTFRSLSDDAQQQILNDIRAADMGTTFTPYDPEPNRGIVPDTALETMAGRRDRLPDQVFDIDTTFDPITLDDRLTTVSPDVLSSIGREQRIDDANTFRQTVPDAANIFGGRQITTTPTGQDLELSPIVAPGISAPKEFRDQFPNAGINIGNINIPTLTSFANRFSNYSRGRVLDSIAQKGYTPVYGGKNNDIVVGAKDRFGNLMEGMDPNAPMGSDDNNENPFILKPKAKEEEKEEKEDKPPNVIGGGDIPDPPAPKSVVVDSPFTSNVDDFVPSSFNTGDINKLIEMLTGVAAPKSMKKGGVATFANGGRVDQALDRFLATA